MASLSGSGDDLSQRLSHSSPWGDKDGQGVMNAIPTTDRLKQVASKQVASKIGAEVRVHGFRNAKQPL